MYHCWREGEWVWFSALGEEPEYTRPCIMYACMPQSLSLLPPGVGGEGGCTCVGSLWKHH